MEIVNLKDHVDHVPELVRLHSEAWGYLRPDEHLDQRIARTTDMCRAAGIPSIFIALDAGILVGSAAIQAKEGLLPDLGRTPWLTGVYVKAEYRSRGIAAMLIRHIEQVALELDFSALHLCTHAHEAYYERFGYRTLQTMDFAGEMTFIMAKPLR
jgi:GNAT superfamily N-acetyltransferase